VWNAIVSVACWLKTHEALAVWIEGIALLAIFLWDRKDSRQQHKETLKQMAIMQSHADASRDNVIAAKDALEREWLPHWHLAMQNIERGVTRLKVSNLSKNSSRVTHLRVRIEAEPRSVKQFELDLPMLGERSENVDSNIAAYIIDTVRPLAPQGAWQGVLEIAVVFLLAHTDEPRPSKWFPFKLAVRDGKVIEVKPKMPYIAADLSE